MIRNIYLIALVMGSLAVAGYAEDDDNGVPYCKKCSLRPRPNTQPNQYEYYEDYLKNRDSKEKSQKPQDNKKM